MAEYRKGIEDIRADISRACLGRGSVYRHARISREPRVGIWVSSAKLPAGIPWERPGGSLRAENGQLANRR